MEINEYIEKAKTGDQVAFTFLLDFYWNEVYGFMLKRTENETDTEDNGSTLKLSWPHLYLGALGFAISLYALRVHNLIAGGGQSGGSRPHALRIRSV